MQMKEIQINIPAMINYQKEELNMIIPALVNNEKQLQLRCSINNENIFSSFVPFKIAPSVSIIDPYMYTPKAETVKIVGSSFQTSLFCQWTDLSTGEKHVFSCQVEQPAFGDIAICRVSFLSLSLIFIFLISFFSFFLFFIYFIIFSCFLIYISYF
jgi:hypothetical protein